MRFVALLLLLTSTLAPGAVLNFTWEPADPAPSSYNLYASTGTTTNIAANVATTNASISVANADWKFMVTALYPGGIESIPSNILPVSVLPPPAPQWTGVTVKKSGNNYDVTLTWAEIPASYYPTNYTVSIMKPATLSKSISVSGSSSRVTFNNVSGGNYTASIFASNMAGAGAHSTDQTFFVPGNPHNLSVKP